MSIMLIAAASKVNTDMRSSIFLRVKSLCIPLLRDYLVISGDNLTTVIWKHIFVWESIDIVICEAYFVSNLNPEQTRHKIYSSHSTGTHKNRLEFRVRWRIISLQCLISRCTNLCLQQRTCLTTAFDLRYYILKAPLTSTLSKWVLSPPSFNLLSDWLPFVPWSINLVLTLVKMHFVTLSKWFILYIIHMYHCDLLVAE